MSLETFSHSAVTDMFVDVFDAVEHGDYYYKQIIHGIWLNKPVIISKQHIQHLDLIKTLSNQDFARCMSNAIYLFLEKNTACGFAEWARKDGRLKWRIG